MKVLMVLTSHDQLGNTGRKTGFWLEELAAPFYVFKDAGAQISLAAPKGGRRHSIPRATSRTSRPILPVGLKRMPTPKTSSAGPCVWME
jgi:putative intracellular protease/amidase